MVVSASIRTNKAILQGSKLCRATRPIIGPTKAITCLTSHHAAFATNAIEIRSVDRRTCTITQSTVIQIRLQIHAGPTTSRVRVLTGGDTCPTLAEGKRFRANYKTAAAMLRQTQIRLTAIVELSITISPTQTTIAHDTNPQVTGSRCMSKFTDLVTTSTMIHIAHQISATGVVGMTKGGRHIPRSAIPRHTHTLLQTNAVRCTKSFRGTRRIHTQVRIKNTGFDEQSQDKGRQKKPTAPAT